MSSSSLIEFKRKLAETEQWIRRCNEAALNTHQARQRALHMLRRRLANGERPESILKSIQGAGGPDPNEGYLMQGGRISFPGVCSHDEAKHTFSIKQLLDEIAREREQQLDLFEMAA